MASFKVPTDGLAPGIWTVLRWRKRLGAPVAIGDVLLQVESDQGLVEITAAASGVLRSQAVRVAGVVKSGDILGEIANAAEVKSASGPTAAVASSAISSPHPAPSAASDSNPPAAPSASAKRATAAAGQSAPANAAIASDVAYSRSQQPQPNPAKEPSMASNQSASAKAPVGKVTPILMPQAGQSMEEGVIVKWHKTVGDAIKEGEVIFEIETDKATMEVEATDSGRLARITVGEGADSPVLKPVAYLAESDADVEAYLLSSGDGAEATAAEGGGSADASQAPAAHAPSSVAVPTSEGGRVKASPAARKLAAERGVDLAAVPAGAGPAGRILSTDVPAQSAAFSHSVGAAQSDSTPQSGAQPAQPARPASAVASAKKPAATAELPPGVTRQKMSSMRAAIARNLSLSKSTIPHWYLSARIDAGALMSFYKSQKSKYPCSVNDVIVMAVAKAMVAFPAFRSRVDGNDILQFPTANIGVAVGMDDGLVVPVVLAAERYTLEALATETKRLANQARAGRIENMGQGTFTISNLGMFGVEEFTAIVNPPEAAILAVGAAADDVIVRDGAMRLGKVMKITLSSDHRLIDGALGAQFMAKLKELLESPLDLLA